MPKTTTIKPIFVSGNEVRYICFCCNNLNIVTGKEASNIISIASLKTGLSKAKCSFCKQDLRLEVL
jgi:hypothetical protein